MDTETGKVEAYVGTYEALWGLPIKEAWIASCFVSAGGAGEPARIVCLALTALCIGDFSGRLASIGEHWWCLITTLCTLIMVYAAPTLFGFVLAAAYIARLAVHILHPGTHKVKNAPQERLDDVVPLGKAKEKIAELVAYLRHPEPFVRIGAKPPRGVLLIGPPGTGKTLLAKALSNEIGPYTSFIHTTGTQLKSMWLGESAEKVRGLFEEAKENARKEQERLDCDILDDPTLARYRGHCVIFVDEIDSFGSRKQGYISKSRDDTVETINELLAQMDGFDPSDGVVVIGTTNDVERLDPAILSRFPCKITTELPNQAERRQIFEKHLRKVQITGILDLDQLAAKTPGLSGRDIKYITEGALWSAATKNASGIDQEELLRAIEEFTASRPLSLDILDRGLAFS